MGFSRGVQNRDVLLEAYMGATHASHGLTREGQPRNVSRRSLRNGFTAARGRPIQTMRRGPATAKRERVTLRHARQLRTGPIRRWISRDTGLCEIHQGGILLARVSAENIHHVGWKLGEAQC